MNHKIGEPAKTTAVDDARECPHGEESWYCVVCQLQNAKETLKAMEYAITQLEAQLRQERDARFVRCLWHENCTLEAGHDKCGECGKGKGGVCSACHCDHTLQVDLRIAERKLEAARNRIDDDTLTGNNLCRSIGLTETVNARLEAQISQLQTTVGRVLSNERCPAWADKIIREALATCPAPAKEGE